MWLCYTLVVWLRTVLNVRNVAPNLEQSKTFTGYGTVQLSPLCLRYEGFVQLCQGHAKAIPPHIDVQQSIIPTEINPETETISLDSDCKRTYQTLMYSFKVIYI